MHRIASSLTEKARNVAKQMIKNGEDIRAIPFREPKDFIFVSKDKNKIVALDLVIVDGQEFYIGHKR